MFFGNDKWYDKYHEITDQINSRTQWWPQEWQQLSQQDIQRLTGWMRCRVEAVIQACEGYTRYWTLNNRCRQVIHKWRFVRVPEPVYDGLTCPKYALCDSNPGSWLAKEQKSRLRFGGRRLLLLNDEAWHCHPYTQGEWQQLSQQDIRRLAGGMRCRVEAVIQACGGYTRYWTLNNRCHQVIHKWRFESEMTILSCFLRMRPSPCGR
jgi:hypothetical protein